MPHIPFLCYFSVPQAQSKSGGFATLPPLPSWFQAHQSFNIAVATANWYNFTHTEALNDPSISGLLELVSGSVARAQSLENATTGDKFREE